MVVVVVCICMCMCMYVCMKQGEGIPRGMGNTCVCLSYSIPTYIHVRIFGKRGKEREGSKGVLGWCEEALFFFFFFALHISL